MRTLILSVIIVLTALVSTGAGVLAFGGSGAERHASATMAMDMDCPSCADPAAPGTAADHALCDHCVACGVLAVSLRDIEASAQYQWTGVAFRHAPDLPAGRFALDDPPIPRV